MTINYSKIGLKVGLEIHQQLATTKKLFCDCPPELFKERPDFEFLRKLRPTQSELGQTDLATSFEFQKGIRILYEADKKTSCLVDMDEEPPHDMNMEAVEIALILSLMMNVKPVDEVHVMRKTVIDGSNTTGFQRTCIISLNGNIKAAEKTISIQAVSLEEDAARKTGNDFDKNILRYRIDRLGIPLIEITTGPEISSPSEAQDVAFIIGSILRDTGRVMRGLGTIRQDLNISLTEGALIEIKGVQALDLISKVVDYEVTRQLNLLSLRDKLKNNGLEPDYMLPNIIDVTVVFSNTECKIIKKVLEKKYVVKALKLDGWAGFLNSELMPGFRIGTEFSDHAKFWGRVGGIFHTDELPNYGITNEEVENLRKKVLAKQEDAVVFVVGKPKNCDDALKAVLDRAKRVLMGVPVETRTAKADGTTRYMRPRPGAARMYPETDIPPIKLTSEFIQKIQSNLPETGQSKIKRICTQHSVNHKLAKQIVDSDYTALFEAIVTESGVSGTTVAAFLTESMKALKREGVKLDNVSNQQIKTIFRYVGLDKITKEVISDVFVWLSKNKGKTVEEAISSLDLKILSENDIGNIVEQIIKDNQTKISKMGIKSFGLIMGLTMKEIRGKANPDVVKKIIMDKLSM